MSIHVFGAVITAPGVAANNRGENEGNITTLQKLLWKDQVHTTVSAEAIRWAIRYYWQQQAIEVNRVWDDEAEDHQWRDANWSGWVDKNGKTYIDDDVLGYMKAEGGKVEGEKGTTEKRRGAFEVSRALSLAPYAGDISFNAKSGEKGRTSLYGTEIHATRYQYGFAMTPQRLRVRSRVTDVINAIVGLGEVAGNHSRFLFDFSPESLVLRLTDDPAPRLLYCFEENDGLISMPDLVWRVEAGDIAANELWIGGPITAQEEFTSLESQGAHLFPGVKNTADEFKKAITALMGG
ncbi:MAG: type I-B CRISPR-associated protein Cas7/Cst2/DevR [Chloroflexota bacterium]|nr:type I-B CRISPR-associated protein Cas7/Cst2/DevR [Chloroflexota bacterium]